MAVKPPTMFPRPAVPRQAVPHKLGGMSAEGRLNRIADAHRPIRYPLGLTDGLCAECGYAHPCPTYTWATTDRDVLATWDPLDENQD